MSEFPDSVGVSDVHQDITLEIGDKNDGNDTVNVSGHELSAGKSGDAMNRARSAAVEAQIADDAEMAQALADGVFSGKESDNNKYDPFTGNRIGDNLFRHDNDILLNSSVQRRASLSRVSDVDSNDDELDIESVGNGRDEASDVDDVDGNHHERALQEHAPPRQVDVPRVQDVQTAINNKVRELRSEFARLNQRSGYDIIDADVFQNMLASLQAARDVNEVESYGTLIKQTVHLANFLADRHQLSRVAISGAGNANDFIRAANVIGDTGLDWARYRCLQLLTEQFGFSARDAESFLKPKSIFHWSEVPHVNALPTLRQELEEIATARLVDPSQSSQQKRSDLQLLLEKRAEARSRLQELGCSNHIATNAMWGKQAPDLELVRMNANQVQWIADAATRASSRRAAAAGRLQNQERTCEWLLTKRFGLDQTQVEAFLTKVPSEFRSVDRALAAELGSIARNPGLLEKPLKHSAFGLFSNRFKGNYFPLLNAIKARSEARAHLTPVVGPNQAEQLVEECTSLDELEVLKDTSIPPNLPTTPPPRRRQNPAAQSLEDDVEATATIAQVMARARAQDRPQPDTNAVHIRPRPTPGYGVADGIDADAAVKNDANRLVSGSRKESDPLPTIGEDNEN